MKIISWNVNGIRAAWGHGLSSFLAETDADIFAFQETKLTEPLSFINKTGYKPYYSFCERKKGYSGTMCLTRYKPVSVMYDMGDKGFDCEGRIITLEFATFFFVNAYFPNTQSSTERTDFRAEWDEHFIQYVSELLSLKPVIICGDMNVTISNNDIYEESKWITLNSEGYLSAERENLNEIIDMGFVDTYRLVHPNERGIYSWWSNRRHKREDNHGWRIDFALVSLDLAEQTRESTMLTDIRGSDHCPVLLELDIEAPKTINLKANTAKKVRLADIPIEERKNLVHSDTRYNLRHLWESIDWDEAEQNLLKMQEALAKSAYSHDRALIAKWQKRIVYSLDAKLLAIRHVTSTSSSTGIDKVNWDTPADKMAAVFSLTSVDYEALPSQMIIIESKKGKKRRVQLGTWRDRAMQTLYAYALDPVAESWADRKSFAFRKGRSAFDLNEYIKLAFSGQNAPEWVFIGDVKQCYEHISHDWVLKYIPVYKPILTEFLKAGYFLSGELFPSDEGVGIGCTLSPIIANMVMDGMQDYIYRKLHGKSLDIDFDNGNLIRYADDIIVAARTEDDAHKIAGYVEEFLALRGMELSKEKSHITNISRGFNFMSRYYVKREGHLYVYPSEAAVERFKSVLEETVNSHTGSQQRLIEKLNRKLDGWATYHKVEQADREFKKVDTFLKALLLNSCQVRHPKWDLEKILQKYWYKKPDGEFVYALPEKREIQVKSLADTVMIHHGLVRTNVNPYIDTDYYEERDNKRAIRNVTGIYKTIWERQDGKCACCGQAILIDQECDVIESPGKGRKVSRLSYIHERCKLYPTVYLYTDTMPDNITDTMDIIDEISERGKHDRNEKKYKPLYEYFLKTTNPVFTLTFDDIEGIMGRKLGRTSQCRPFWNETGYGKISNCWLDNGYEIKYLHTDKRYVVFQKVGKNTGVLEIPEVFLSRRIPDDAKYELENYFQYIKKKYGL